MTVTELKGWWESPLGRILGEQEQRVVREALEDVFGLQFLQVGAWGRPDALLEAVRTQRRITVDVDFPAGLSNLGGNVVGRPSSLPIAAKCIDAVLLPHTLEFDWDPYATLREVERVLVGDGKLIVLGFSPLGLWAMRHRFSHDSFPPGLKRLISPRRLREWLRVLSFEVSDIKRYLFQVPSAAHADKRWPAPAGAYLLKAHKRVYALTPVRPKWREKRSLVTGLVKPTSS